MKISKAGLKRMASRVTSLEDLQEVANKGRQVFMDDGNIIRNFFNPREILSRPGTEILWKITQGLYEAMEETETDVLARKFGQALGRVKGVSLVFNSDTDDVDTISKKIADELIKMGVKV